MDFGPAVGTGGYAVVRRAVHRATGEIVAVKIMSLGRPSASAQGGSSSDDDSNSGDEDGSSAEDSGSDSDASSLHDMSISYQEVDIFLKINQNVVVLAQLRISSQFSTRFRGEYYRL